ncbi:malectin, partial [Pontibacter silvestris]
MLINAGGGQYKDSRSRTWSADTNFSGGKTASKQISISGTSDNALYNNYRYASNGSPLDYSIPVKEAGTYTVKLHFVEPYFRSSNSRVFNIDVEGKRLATSYDIYKEAGFGKAVVKTYTATISDGKLGIRLSSVKNNAIISAIEIIKQ